MRRNRNNPGNQRQAQMSPNGPLLTSHLRDLDIELELLKRKREIIEQKQDILNRERYSTKRQYDYNPTNSYNNRQEPYGFTQQYDGPSNSGNYRPQGNKRQAEPHNQNWNAKRFNAPQVNPWQGGSSKNFSQERQFQPFIPQLVQFPAPLMSLKPNITVPRPQKKFQPSAPRKNFHPSKVVKPKAQTTQVPNKLASYPKEKTKQLVNNAMKAIDKKPSTDQILLADVPPSAQVRGRLELALGVVLKEMRSQLSGEDLEHFLSPGVQRLVKVTVRARIRRLMLGKCVGVARDVVAAYRKRYNADADRALLNVAYDAHDVNLLDADDPEEFFKKNMTKVLTNKLEDMFTKLEKLYKTEESTNLDDCINKLPEPNTSEEKKPEAETKPATLEELCGEDGSLTVLKEKIGKTRFYTEVMEKLIEDRLPKILPKFKNVLLSTVFCEKEFLNTKAMITAQLKRKILKTIEQDESYLVHNKKVGNDKSGDTEKETAPTSDKNETNSEPQAEDVKTATKTQENTTIEINDDNDVVEVKASTKEVDDKVEPVKTEDVKIVEAEKKPVSEVTSVPDTPNKAPASNPQTPKVTISKEIHYVKLIGRPTLPARAVIYDFLTQFKPQSIKKHKSISNLLVIGFNDKSNFDKILEANDSVVGESTIIIKASEQVNATKSTPTAAKAASTPNKKSLNESLEDSSILGADLDSQITDLLTSIRQSEESVSVNENKESNGKGEESKAQDVVEIIDDDSKPEENGAKDNVGSENGPNIKQAENKVDEKKDGNEISTNGNNEMKSDEKMETDGQNADANSQKSAEPMDTEKELEAIKEGNEAVKDSSQDDQEVKKVEDKTKANVKETARPATPTRSSSRIANSTPNTIRTRRTSRLQ